MTRAIARLLNLLWLLSVSFLCAQAQIDRLRTLGPQAVNLWKLQQLAKARTESQSFAIGSQQHEFKIDLPSTKFKAQYFAQPLDHFSNTSHTFDQRYWVNSRHYQPGSGGPVIVLDGGETSGEDRLPFLDTGIVDILARATGGLGVVLEHRYYGGSIPVSNFSTDSLRWLDNDQSAADSANFIRNVKFEGIDEDLTAPHVPWIYYGGSYAGARAAHMRVLYPEIVFGAIASSAVTHAAVENWEYMEVIRKAADPKCSYHLEKSIKTIDTVLTEPKFVHLRKPLKALFDLGGLEHDDDFVSLLSYPLGSWQAKVWDPKVGSTAFDEFCAELNRPPLGSNGFNFDEIAFGEKQRRVHIGGPGGLVLDFSILNYARYIRKMVKKYCPEGMDVEECFGTYDDTKYQDTSLEEEWRTWNFQVCTEWGYFTTSPPDSDQPRIVSRLLTLDYLSKTCAQAFPPGKHFQVPKLPNVTAVNVLGDFGIAYDRLAIIDGEVDPWRPDTPHSEYAEDREDTVLRPFKLIPNGVHHYDEYGLRNLEDEPPEIRKIHGEMIVFVMEWLKDWEA